MTEVFMIGAIIGILTVIANAFIAAWSIKTNRQIAQENAGKNRAIYGVERINFRDDITAHREEDSKLIRNKLNSGKYTILHFLPHPNDVVNSIIILGKIKNE